MANETLLTLVGNLTADPELAYTPTGAAYARFTVASTPRTFDKTTNAWRDGDALFLTCTAWRDLAENITESLRKGTRVVVTGRLRLSRWETPDGDKRSAHVLDVEDVGPSLRFATASITKTTRTTGAAPSGWDVGPVGAAPSQSAHRTPVPAGADLPPF